MRSPFLTQRTALTHGRVESSREGRDCELSRRVSALLLFPRLNSLPGPWLLVLVGACSYVAIRALELAQF